MALDALAMAKWSAKILNAYTAKLRYVAMCNRDYEGDVKFNGSVKIFTEAEVTDAAYTRDSTTISYGRLTPGEQMMAITQRRYFAFKSDDLEKQLAAAGGVVWNRAIQRGSYNLAKTADTYVGGVMQAAVPSANQLTARTVGTGLNANFYEMIVDLLGLLRAGDVPEDGNVHVCIPTLGGDLLRKDERFVSFNTADAVANIQGRPIGKIGNAMVLESTNCLVSGSTYTIIAAHTDATTYAEQMSKLEQLPRNADDFDDRLRSQLVYDAKVIKQAALASVDVQFGS